MKEIIAFNQQQIEHISTHQKLVWNWISKLMEDVLEHDKTKFSETQYSQILWSDFGHAFYITRKTKDLIHWNSFICAFGVDFVEDLKKLTEKSKQDNYQYILSSFLTA